MSKKLTYEYVKNYIESFGYTLLSTEYINSRTKLLLECPFGHKWETSFNNFKNCNHRCCECYGNKKKEYEDYKTYIELQGYELLSKEINNTSSNILLKCLNGHEWSVKFSNFYHKGYRCPYCSDKAKYTYEEVKEYIENEEYKLLSEEYINNITKLKILCNNNHIFEMDFNHFKNRSQRCPYCNVSKGEQKIINWLDKNNIEYVYDKPYFDDLFGNFALLRPDFILPNEKIWIEYDGEQYYQDIYRDGSYEKTQIYDEIKNKYAKENGWRLIRIPYLEIDNIEIILDRIINK